MLNGIAPIIIFQFKKLTPQATEALSKIPLVSSIVDSIGLPPIPIYLDENLTGIYIDGESKAISIDTEVQTLSDGSTPNVVQKAINSTTTIEMKASQTSLGLTLLSAICDKVVPLVTSQEYSITYLNGAVTIFGGLLHDLKITPEPNTDLLIITLELTNGNGKTKEASTVPKVTPVTESVNLGSGVSPTAPLAPPLTGPPTPSTPTAAPVKINRG